MGGARVWRRPAVLAAVPLLVFGDFLLQGRAILPGDGFIYYLPLHGLAALAWRAGHVPTWNPFSFAGAPLLAVGQAGVFYPPNLAFGVFSLATANNLVTLLNFAVAGTGAFLLARRLTGDDDAALVAGLAFSLSGFMFGHVAHQSMTATVSWLPWAFYAFELLRDAITPRRLLLGGGALALSAVAGHTQMFVFAVAVLGLYAGFVTLLDWRTSRTRPLGPLAAMVGVGLGLAAVQLLPTLAVLDASARGSTLSYPAATSFSFPGSHLPLLAFPYLFGNAAPSGPFTAPYQGMWNLTELNGYPGMAALALAAVGLAAARRDRRVLAFAGIGLVGILMALGAATPLGRIVYAVPVLGRFRSWGRYAVTLDLAVAVLAAYGVAGLRVATGAARRTAIVRAAAVPAGLALLALAVQVAPATRPFLARGVTGTLAVAAPLTAALAGVACCRLIIARSRGAIALTAAVVVLDAVLSFGGFFEWRGASPSSETLRTALSADTDPVFGAVSDASGGIDRYLFAGSDLAAVAQQAPLTDLKELRSANGSEPLASRSYLDALHMNASGIVTDPGPLWPEGSRILDLLRISTVLADPQSTAPMPDGSSLVRDGRAVPGSRLVRYDYQPRLPDAFVVGAVRRVGHDEVLDGLWGRHPFDPAATALLDDDCGECAAAQQPGSAGAVQRIRWGTSSVDVTLEADRAGMLVVSQAWFPGWTASVDGRPAPVVRVDGLVQGVPVGPGTHQVNLSYRAPGLRAGTALTGCTAAGLALAALIRRRRRHLFRSAIASPTAGRPPSSPWATASRSSWRSPPAHWRRWPASKTGVSKPPIRS